MRLDSNDSRGRRLLRYTHSNLARIARAGGLALAIAVFGVACGGGNGDETGPSPDTATDTGVGPDTSRTEDTESSTENLDATLETEGVAVTDAAVFVSPKYSGLDRIVAVQSSTVTGITDATPLPSEATKVGDHSFEVSAGRDVEISTREQGLYIVLPVPASFDGEPSQLAVAARTPAHSGPGDSIDSSVSHLWSVQPGYYVPQARAFAFPAHFLMADGSEYTLVKSKEYDSRTLEFPNRDFGTSGERSSKEQGLYRTNRHPLIHKTKVGKAVGNAVKSVADAIGKAFEEIGESVSEEVKKAIKKVADTIEEAKKCVNNRGWKLRPNFFVNCRRLNCDTNAKQEVRSHLKRVHDQFRPEFNKPDLTRTLPCRKVEKSDGSTQWGRFYNYTLRQANTGLWCDDTPDGQYIAPTNTALTCFEPSGDSLPDTESTTRMEFFHAIQFNYGGMSWHNFGEKGAPSKHFPSWIVEGQGSAVENTNTTPEETHRSDRPLRFIDTTLNAADDRASDYNSQDFWTYLVNARNSTTKETFVPVLSAQPGLSQKPDLGRLKQLFDLEKHHWGWVRNQAFEARMTEGFDGALNETCRPDEDAWDSPLTTINYDPSARSSPLRETLRVDGDWKAEVAEIDVTNGASNRVKFVFSAEGHDSNPVKLYADTDSATQACLNRNEPRDQSSLEDFVSAGGDPTYYLLMDHPRGGNTFNDPTGVYDLKIEHLAPNGDKQRPEGQIVKPESGAEFERNGQTLEADASDPGPPGNLTYDWKITHDGMTEDDPDNNGDPNEDGNPVTLSSIPDDENSFSNTVRIELTVTDLEGQSATFSEEREPSCAPIYHACNKDKDCCSRICGNGTCVSL